MQALFFSVERPFLGAGPWQYFISICCLKILYVVWDFDGHRCQQTTVSSGSSRCQGALDTDNACSELHGTVVASAAKLRRPNASADESHRCSDASAHNQIHKDENIHWESKFYSETVQISIISIPLLSMTRLWKERAASI